MKRLFWISCMLASAVLCSPAPARAEFVSHHNTTVDADSPPQDCISCHDGSVAKHVSFCTVRCNFSGSHSMMKHYPPAGQSSRYAPAAAVQARGIKLQNGQVTCISCHNLRNPSPGHLVMDNAGSRLCLSCHITM
ncbi:MAG: cytochrome c3 family protein [Nitrospirota bacterium]